MKRQSKAWTWLKGHIVAAAVCFVAAAFLLSAGVTYLWFYEEGTAEGGVIEMGRVELAVAQGEFLLPVGQVSSHRFSIASDSTIPYYLRLGVTLVCRDGEGAYLPVHIPDDLYTVTVDRLTENENQVDLRSSMDRVGEGYEKGFVTLLSAGGGGDHNNRLLAFSPGLDTRLDGTLTVRLDLDRYPDFFDQVGRRNGSLYLVLVPEGIQATSQAVEGLSAYGWDADLVS